MSKWFVSILLMILLLSCDSNIVYTEYQSLPGRWNPNDKVQFTLPEIDSTSHYNLFINLRNTHQYPFSNLFLIASINFPNGKVVSDTLEYEMALPDGRWLGKGRKIIENKLWYKENIQFFETGTYTLEIQHAMRNLNQVEGVQLEGVTDIGISIEKVVPNH